MLLCLPPIGQVQVTGMPFAGLQIHHTMKILSRTSKEKRINHCEELAQTWPQLQLWYRTELGQQLALHEAEMLAETLPNLFGYHLLQLGRLSSEDWLGSSRISHCAVMDFLSPHTDKNERRLYGLPDQLPIQTDCMDVMVLPHTLEFSLRPHAVLREAERALIPEGHLVMLVFNAAVGFWQEHQAANGGAKPPGVVGFSVPRGFASGWSC